MPQPISDDGVTAAEPALPDLHAQRPEQCAGHAHSGQDPWFTPHRPPDERGQDASFLFLFPPPPVSFLYFLSCSSPDRTSTHLSREASLRLELFLSDKWMNIVLELPPAARGRGSAISSCLEHVTEANMVLWGLNQGDGNRWMGQTR